MMPGIIATIAEERIREAEQRGVFDNLPGSGRPLALEDESMIPEDLRMAYKILRNAGFVPPEILEKKEISTLVDMLEKSSDEGEKVRQIQKLNCLLQRMNTRRNRPIHLQENDPYYQSILERIRLLGGKGA